MLRFFPSPASFLRRRLPAIAVLGILISAEALAESPTSFPVAEYLPCEPSSELTPDAAAKMAVRPALSTSNSGGIHVPELDFCSEWNPEFPFNGHHCCRNLAQSGGRRRGRRRYHGNICLPGRTKSSFCDERTDEQREYEDAVAAGKIDDTLAVIGSDIGKRKDQAFCTVNNGFLAYGRPIVGTDSNRIQLRAPARCSNFGTDEMAGLLEWLGRQVATSYNVPEYRGLRLLLGDVSAPRGGCLAGNSGRLGHASHTTGQDADVGFLTPRRGIASPSSFGRDFDAHANWWMIKKILSNPYACVKVIFLDKRLIRKLGKAAGGDADWPRLARFIRHMPGHQNHMHVRIGDSPGAPGCAPDAHPELEVEEDLGDTPDGLEEVVAR